MTHLEEYGEIPIACKSCATTLSNKYVKIKNEINALTPLDRSDIPFDLRIREIFNNNGLENMCCISTIIASTNQISKISTAFV